jgi:pimeloyl-ACP methyl ester carboxylesterase
MAHSSSRGLSLFIIILLVLSGCGNKKTTLATGEFKLSVPGGRIRYKVSGTGKKVPVVLIHGGPGDSSSYLKPFEELGNDRQVISYDQFGGGKSDKITDTTLFTIDHFVKELDLLREASRNYDDPAYQAVMNQYYSLYVFRNPVQADLDSMFSTYNPEIYTNMGGPSEFTITGTLKDYNPVSFLSEIKVPTLFKVGEFDEINPTIIKELADKVPEARYINRLICHPMRIKILDKHFIIMSQ